MGTIIEIKGLTKEYGTLTALDDLTLAVEEGAVIGFLGPNGAGKTTTMRILTTLMRPTAGEAWVAGYSIHADPEGVRRSIGYMPDFFGVYEDMKVWEYLDFYAACYDIAPGTRKGLIDDLLALVDLGHKKEAFVEELSRGMKQRLCLARTLAHDPRVLFLDEPASGLDPRARIEMRELLRELRNMGKTIFFSSHILSEVADVCTSIAVLEAGKLIAYGDIGEMRRRLRPHRLVAMRILGEEADLRAAQELILQDEHAFDGHTTINELPLPPGVIQFSFTGSDAELSAFLRRMMAHNIPVVSFQEKQDNLEDVFMQVTKGIIN